MSSFNELFDTDKTFTMSTKAVMPMDRTKWDEFILGQFMNTIQLPPEVQPAIEYINADDAETVVLGAVRVKFMDRIVSFPFIVKNGKLSPFDLIVVGGKTYPAAPAYLEKIFTRDGLGEIMRRDTRRPGSQGLAKTLGGTFIGQSLPEVMRLADGNKMASLFKDNLKVAEAYYKTHIGNTLNGVLQKVSDYKKQQMDELNKVIVKSAVCQPVSIGSVKVGMLTNKGYVENVVNFGQAEKMYPEEVAFLVKKAADGQDIAHTYNLTSATGNLYPDQTRIPLIAITGPHMTTGNMIDFSGSKMNYNVKVNDMLATVGPLEVATSRQVLFNQPDTNNYTPPFFVRSRKKMIGPKSEVGKNVECYIFDGVDSFDRQIRIIIDPTIKFLYVESTKPYVVRVPAEWPIYNVPVSAKGTPGTYSARKTASFIEAALHSAPTLDLTVKVAYNPFTKRYTLSGTPDKDHNVVGVEWVKAATILNYYAGDQFKDAYQKPLTEYKVSSKPFEKSASVKPIDYKSDPIFLKLAAIIPNEQTADTLLGLNYMTPNVLDDADEYLPKLEDAASNLSDLLLTSRMTEALPEDDIKKSITYILKVVQAIKDTLTAKDQLDQQAGIV